MSRIDDTFNTETKKNTRGTFHAKLADKAGLYTKKLLH